MADYDQRISQLEASISQLQNFIRSSRNTDTSSTKRLHHESRRSNGTGEPVSQQDPWDAVESMLAKISKEVEAIKFDIANTQDKSDGLIALETATHSEPCSDLPSNTRGQGEAIRHEEDPFNGLPLRHPDPTVVDSGTEAILETGSDHWSTLSSPLTPLSDVEQTNEHFTSNADQLGKEPTKSTQPRTPLPTSPGRKSSTAQSKQISANRNSLAVVIQSPQFIATPDPDRTITEDSLAPGEMVTVEPSKDNTNNHSAQPVATPAQDGRESPAAIFQLPLAGNNDDGTLSLDVDAALEPADMAMAPVPLPITPVSSRQEDTARGCQVGTPKSVQSPTTLGAQGDTGLVERQVTSSQSQPHSAGNESVSLPVTLDGDAARTQVAAQGIDDVSRVRTTTDTSALLLSPESPPSLSHAALSPADMGEKLTLKLAEMDANNMSQKFFVPPVDIDLGQIQSSINAGNDGWQFTSIRYKPTPKEGCTNVYISDAKSDLDWSAFTQEIKRPTVEQARRIFEDTVQHPPKGDIDYYVGHANIPLMRPLNPGPRILQDQGLKDLHTAYHHIGTNLSANRMHQEDMTCRDPASTSPKYHGFRSYNEVYFGTGYKLWLVIAEYHIAKFDDFFKDNWACGECSQGLGHESLLFSPSRLEKEGIDYEIYVIGRQEAFRTKPGQQHQIINYGFNVARSINYAHLDDKLMPENCAFCPYCHMKPALEQKGAKSVTLPRPLNESPSLVGKRKADGQDLGTTRQTRACTTAKQKWNQLEGKVKKADPYCHFPVILNPSEFQSDVLRKAVSVRSSLAVKQFMGLVHEWRRRGTHIVISDDAGDLCLQHGRRLKAAAEHSSLSKFELRYAQACVARHVDRQVKGRGQIRRNKEITDRLAKDLDMDSKELKYHLEDGRLWNSVCGPKCEGLLPFFLLDSYKPLDPDQLLYICKKEWRALKDEHLGAFHSLLQDDYIENLCRAGVAFQEILSKGAKHIFSWEKEGLDITAKDWASFLWKMESSPHAD